MPSPSGSPAAAPRVIVTDIRQDTAEATAQEIRSSGGEASAFPLDVTDAEACTALAEQVGREIGAVNVLVNNAGIIIRETSTAPAPTKIGAACST